MAKTIALSGSCLCSDKSYEASGTLLGFFHCHCGRCRKASGTGHGSLIILTPGELEIYGNKDDIGWYKVPDAIRFGNRFCKQCGGPLPRIAEEEKRVIVQAGTLDDPIDIEPQCEIFWGSKAEWSCSGSGLPTFDKYPD